MRVALVLRSGGEFHAAHVDRLCRQIRDNLPAADIVCLTDDFTVRCPWIPLKFRWPSWWSKMELFRPDIHGDMLYMDLDTTIVGDLNAIASVDRLTVLSDFYFSRRMQSSLMFIPEAERAMIWHEWIDDPARHMKECRTRDRWGDQGFLDQFWGKRAQRWQHIFPGQVVSYKCHVRERTRVDKEFGDGRMPRDARIICFHGRPRPWEVGNR